MARLMLIRMVNIRIATIPSLGGAVKNSHDADGASEFGDADVGVGVDEAREGANRHEHGGDDLLKGRRMGGAKPGGEVHAEGFGEGGVGRRGVGGQR